MSQFKFDYAGRQILGSRDRQEDALDFRLSSNRDGALVGALADGIGGLLSGDRAAKTAVSSFLDAMECNEGAVDEARMTHAVESANAALLEILEGSDLSGCTFIGIVVTQDSLQWVSVGDSYLWLFRDHRLKRLNEDHSFRGLLKEGVEAGKLTEAEARAHPHRSRLLSYLGGETIERIDSGHLSLESGDRIIAGTDGLEPLLEDGQLAQLLSDLQDSDAASTCAAVLDRLKSLQAEHQDNTTVIVVNFMSS